MGTLPCTSLVLPILLVQWVLLRPPFHGHFLAKAPQNRYGDDSHHAGSRWRNPRGHLTGRHDAYHDRVAPITRATCPTPFHSSPTSIAGGRTFAIRPTMSSPNIPPVQQAYFAKRREPVPYNANTTSGSANDGGYVDSAHIGSHQKALPAYATYQAPEKVAVRGVAYVQFMSTLQTIFQLGILVCMIAMVAKLYQVPSTSSSSSRY